jgi:hypothetical protein
MSLIDESGLDWSLSFEPDEDAEEELADEPEPIDKALVTDETIRKCRIIAAVHCIEYGTVKLAPGQSTPGMLLVLSLTFHPYESRVKEAFVELAFNKAAITVLQPESVDDSESEEIIRKKLYGELSIGYPPAGVNATLGGERETERKKVSALRIRGSGTHTHRATWTLKENPEAQGGIHLNFMAVAIMSVNGEMEVDVEIRAKIGATVKNVLGIRKIITQQTKKFDGKTFLGRRPETLEIHESAFKVDAGKSATESK